MDLSLIARVKKWLTGVASGRPADLHGSVGERLDSQPSDETRLESAAGEVLRVQHSAIVGQRPQRQPFPYTCYYRTEVRNDAAFPLRIERFEGWRFERGKWEAGNVLGRPLTSADFDDWYNDGDPIAGGWIPANSTAACDPNYHGNSTGSPMRVKWVFEAIDEAGRVYRAEMEVPPPICHRRPHLTLGSEEPATQE